MVFAGGHVSFGDVFDSLAEDDVPGYVAVDESEAKRFMERIYADASFQPVWRALEAFLQTPDRYLIFVIGNHDIELALPVVQAFLVDRLSGGDNDRISRIRFATTGAGYACLVGAARVYCTHGNEMDPFNWVDYNSLGQLANAMNAGRQIEKKDWEPNAGTRLVVDIMNVVKKRYPFVDILKPETNAVAAVLLAIDKETFAKIDLRNGIPVLRGLSSGRKVVSNLLGDDLDATSATPELMAERVLDEIIGPNMREALKTSTDTEDELLMEAISSPEADPWEGEELDGELETLGWEWGRIVAGRLGLIDKAKALRLALLDWIQDEVEFDPKNKDSIYKEIKDRIGPGIEFVVTGHTHKARAIDMPGGCFYFNSGTWIRTLRFTKESLKDQDYFDNKLWPGLKDTTLDKLDKLKIPGPTNKKQLLLDDRTHTVRISADGSSVTGELLRVTDSGPGGVNLSVEKGTKTCKVNKL